MRESLAKWISDDEALWQQQRLRAQSPTLDFSPVSERLDDYYFALVGELFDQMREGTATPEDCAQLGNALSYFASPERVPAIERQGVSVSQVRLFSAMAFYIGGFPASAYLEIRDQDAAAYTEQERACVDLLAQSLAPTSEIAIQLIEALRQGNAPAIAELLQQAEAMAAGLVAEGPEAWLPAHLLSRLLRRFSATNIRAVLPDGYGSFWNPLVKSLLDRQPPLREFFPSQMQAIGAGLTDSPAPYSMQMPTGAGKTALTEVLLYRHLNLNPTSKAVLVVPLRSLAAELKYSVAKRLTEMGLPTRSVYGGSVPSPDEVGEASTARALITTPEALSGLLGATPDLMSEISLVVVDEGHLLDAGSRGVHLELLISRFKARAGGPPRFVFLSAIVPNIEEINSWMGGTNETVVRSQYRPARGDFAVLRPFGSGVQRAVALEMHPHLPEPIKYRFPGFLTRGDFTFRNPNSGRTNTYSFGGVNTIAVACARKALSMGVVALFAAHKRGNQGAIGLAGELLKQIDSNLPLPLPATFANNDQLGVVAAYLEDEFGDNWIGCRALRAGAILHHGDLPQETREVLEHTVRRNFAKLVICTSTLAEGVNLPIRTLVLYSVERSDEKRRVALLARDIKNLVGRAGRAGASTAGLIICANDKQWRYVETVANDSPVEPVRGALLLLMQRLHRFLASQQFRPTNEDLDGFPPLHSLIDGLDATLVDLAASEIGDDQLRQVALEVAEQTLAFRFADEAPRNLLREVVSMRAQKVVEIRASGRLAWIKETGARCRMLSAVEQGLLPARESWENIVSPTDPALVATMVDWAWSQGEMRDAVKRSYGVESDDEIDAQRAGFLLLLSEWLNGSSFQRIATVMGRDVDSVLGIYTHVASYTFQVLAENGIALLRRFIETGSGVLSEAVIAFPDHVRFGVPTVAGRHLAQQGLRHRKAYVGLGTSLETGGGPENVFARAQLAISVNPDAWRAFLGTLVYENTREDLRIV